MWVGGWVGGQAGGREGGRAGAEARESAHALPVTCVRRGWTMYLWGSGGAGMHGSSRAVWGVAAGAVPSRSGYEREGAFRLQGVLPAGRASGAGALGPPSLAAPLIPSPPLPSCRVCGAPPVDPRALSQEPGLGLFGCVLLLAMHTRPDGPLRPSRGQKTQVGRAGSRPGQVRAGQGQGWAKGSRVERDGRVGSEASLGWPRRGLG